MRSLIAFGSWQAQNARECYAFSHISIIKVELLQHHLLPVFHQALKQHVSTHNGLSDEKRHSIFSLGSESCWSKISKSMLSVLTNLSTQTDISISRGLIFSTNVSNHSFNLVGDWAKNSRCRFSSNGNLVVGKCDGNLLKVWYVVS